MRRTLILVALASAFSAYGAPKCVDLCVQISKPCYDPCKTLKNPNAKAECRQSCDVIDKACKESCAKKGRIDPEYLKSEFLKTKPKGTGTEGRGKTVKVDEGSGSGSSSAPSH